jgi:polyhydroxyalkanoate synthesis regulator phasin
MNMGRTLLAVALAVLCCAAPAQAKFRDTLQVTADMVPKMHIKEIRYHLYRRGERCGDCGGKKDFAAALVAYLNDDATKGILSAHDFKAFVDAVEEEAADKKMRKGNRDENMMQDILRKAGLDGSQMPAGANKIDGLYESMQKQKRDRAAAKAEKAARADEPADPDSDL